MNRTVTVQLAHGGSVVVTEPTWCVASHLEPVGDRTEVVHEGPETSLTVQTMQGPHRLLAVALEQAPLSAIDRTVKAVVDLGGHFAGFDADGLRALAAGLVVHAGQLRDLAAGLAQLRAEAEAGGPGE